VWEEAVVVDGCSPASSCEPIVEPYPEVPTEAAVETAPDEAPAVEEETPAVEEAPAEEAVDEPIVLPPVEEETPAEQVTPPAEDGMDIFGEPPAAEEAAPPAEEAAPMEEESLDDIFSTPPAAEEAAPAVEEATPSTEGAPAEESTDSLDDLFGDTSAPTTDAEPRMATTPDESNLDDLFGDVQAETPAAEAPATEAAPAADDLFPAETEEAAPAEATPAPADSSDLDDLFGQRPPRASSATHMVEQPTTQLTFRRWTDNTGNYTTVGRLVQVGRTHVRLLKDNGRFTTVSRTRLSQADLAYVDQMVQQLGLQIIDQFAQR
jgi:hypothetical protein